MSGKNNGTIAEPTLPKGGSVTAPETPIAEIKPPEPKPAPIAVAQAQRIVVHDDLLYIMDTGKWDQMWRIAKAMAMASLAPNHLKGQGIDESTANCMMVVNQACRWGLDPFAVAPCSYVVKNRLGFEGKLIAALVNARGGLKTKLAPIYNSKKGKEFAAVIYGSDKELDDADFKNLAEYAENEDRKCLNELARKGIMAIRISVEQGATENTMWTTDPEQKLFYTGVTKWARRHRPELLLGVLTDDDFEQMGMQAGKKEGPTTLPANGTAKLRQTKGKTVEAPKQPEPETKPATTEETITDQGEVVDAEYTVVPDVKAQAKEENPAPEPEAPKPPTTRQLEAMFREAQPDHIAFRVTKDKEGILRAKCTCGGAWIAKTIGAITVFEKDKEGDGSCGVPEEPEPTSTFNEETNRLEQNDVLPMKKEPAKDKITNTPEDDAAEKIMQLPAAELNQFFEEHIKAAGKMNLPERRKSVTPTIAMIRRKLELSTSPIQVQQAIQWLVKANFVLSMDGERHEKLKAEISAKSKAMSK